MALVLMLGDLLIFSGLLILVFKMSVLQLSAVLDLNLRTNALELASINFQLK